jgi:ABC-type dipeptide/oligopeptide/nickel transport system permease subunit
MVDEFSVHTQTAPQPALLPQTTRFNRVVAYLGENPLVIIAALILIIVILLAIMAPWVAPQDPYKMTPVDRLKQPGSAGYPLGTDSFGRDLLSRIIWGGRISLLAGIIPALAAMVISVVVGLISGYVGGRLDSLIMGLVDILLAFPFMLLAIALVAALGPSLQNAMLAVIITTVPARLRLIRGETLSLAARPFVDAARVLGYSSLRILFVEIMPNVMAIAITMFTIDITIMITATAGLSFLGLGVQPPQADWGTMIADGKQFMTIAPHITLIPSLALTLVCLCFAVLGDAVQDLLNPRAVLE